VCWRIFAVSSHNPGWRAGSGVASTGPSSEMILESWWIFPIDRVRRLSVIFCKSFSMSFPALRLAILQRAKRRKKFSIVTYRGSVYIVIDSGS
jgi:hypothetical protein